MTIVRGTKKMRKLETTEVAVLMDDLTSLFIGSMNIIVTLIKRF